MSNEEGAMRYCYIGSDGIKEKQREVYRYMKEKGEKGWVENIFK